MCQNKRSNVHYPSRAVNPDHRSLTQQRGHGNPERLVLWGSLQHPFYAHQNSAANGLQTRLKGKKNPLLLFHLASGTCERCLNCKSSPLNNCFFKCMVDWFATRVLFPHQSSWCQSFVLLYLDSDTVISFLSSYKGSNPDWIWVWTSRLISSKVGPDWEEKMFPDSAF